MSFQHPHLSHLPQHLQSCFEAGLAPDATAHRCRHGGRSEAASSLKSFWLAPIRDAAARAVVTGRLARCRSQAFPETAQGHD
jgi:hypothetical protein